MSQQPRLSEWTVVNHGRQVMRRLDVPSRIHVAQWVMDRQRRNDLGRARTERRPHPSHERRPRPGTHEAGRRQTVQRARSRPPTPVRQTRRGTGCH
ncbi:hypothetical protein CA983_03695 [Streptomyces swartbergensis]|uniref:Uncharacterized protein n=1 Tax=Streptomyces swartbergensis TaxID=487165 RepID=A0A243SA09_9ACTN|nr:hypothetical protein [Streptomyces swartbergensis]OUD04479.1 hypothetical protein CA983_03695 [Streptomyces swartbergensis]